LLEALASFDEALGLDPRHVKGIITREEFCLQGHVELALKRFEMALSINPDFKKATINCWLWKKWL